MVTAEPKAVRLSGSQVAYLKSARFLEPSLTQIVEAAEALEGDSHIVRVARDVAEQFRAAFTDRLAKVGFDAQYELTDEGRMLEDLIDRFHYDYR